MIKELGEIETTLPRGWHKMGAPPPGMLGSLAGSGRRFWIDIVDGGRAHSVGFGSGPAKRPNLTRVWQLDDCPAKVADLCREFLMAHQAPSDRPRKPSIEELKSALTEGQAMGKSTNGAPEIDRAIKELIRTCARTVPGGTVAVDVKVRTGHARFEFPAELVEDIAALAAVGLRVRQHGTDALGALMEAEQSLKHIAQVSAASASILTRLLHD